jgi:glutaredoxin
MTFTVYSRTGCSYCEKIKQLFDLNEFQYVEYVLDKDFTRDQFYSEFGEGTTFPQVIFEEKQLGGCIDTIQYLQEKNICCNV